MAAFDVSVRNPKLALASVAGRAATGAVELTVTNRLEHRVKVRGAVSVAEPTKADWFAVDGEKTLETSATVTFTVTVTIPAGTPPGAYEFRPIAASVEDPSNESEVGPPVTVTLAAGRRSRWWIWAAAAGGAALLVALAVVLVLALRPARQQQPDAAAGCARDSDCPPERRLCIRAACQAPVPNGKDCKEGRECASGNCVRLACAPAGACASDGDCKAPATCNRGFCGLRALDEACANDAQCASGRCVRGACGDKLQCVVDGNCASGNCQFGWCRDAALRRMQEVTPGSGRSARPNDTVDVELVVTERPVLLPTERTYDLTVQLGRTQPAAFTDVLLGLAVGGTMELDPVPFPSPLPVPVSDQRARARITLRGFH
jgi:hypothetical protein